MVIRNRPAERGFALAETSAIRHPPTSVDKGFPCETKDDEARFGSSHCCSRCCGPNRVRELESGADTNASASSHGYASAHPHAGTYAHVNTDAYSRYRRLLRTGR
jgi:hypothetical protein